MSCAPKQVIRQKRGDVFRASGEARHRSTGLAYDLTGATVECSVKGGNPRTGAFVQSLTCTHVDSVISVYASPAQTADWPLGTLESDIKVTIAGEPVSSFTFEIVVREGVT